MRAFLLLRDFFGYLLPGAAFLSILAVSQHPSESSLTLGSKLPMWGAVVALLGASYVAGHLMAAIGHAIQDATSFVFGAVRQYAANLVGFKWWKDRKKTRGVGSRRRAGFPLSSESLALHYRRLYPQLFVELDRRETLALLRTGLGASFFVGSWSFPLSLELGIVLLIGVVLLLSGYAGRRHVALYRIATLRAAIRAERAQKQPLEPQSGSTHSER